MNRLSIACFLLAASLRWLGAQTVMSARWLITGAAAGPFQIGMSVDTAKSAAGVDRFQLLDLESEGLFSPAVIVLDARRRRSLVAEIVLSDTQQWIFWRIQVYDPRYRTSQGIGVGSTYSQLKRASAALRLFNEEGSRYLVDARQGISYALDDKPRNTARVTSLLLTGATGQPTR